MKYRELWRAILRANAESGAKLGRATTDAMALPSYLQGNVFSRRVFWGRLQRVFRLARCVPYSKALDFGCGTGVLLPRLAAGGREVYATDLRLEIARQTAELLRLPPIRFIPAEHWEAEVPDGQIETIIAADVLEHIDRRREILSALCRKLTPSGRLVICGPTENRLYRLGRRIVGFSGAYHVTTVHHVLRDAESVGLKKVQTTDFPLPGPGCLFKIAVFTRASEILGDP